MGVLQLPARHPPDHRQRGAIQLTARRVAALAAVAGAVLALLLPIPAGLVEAWYSRGLYPVLQSGVTRVSSLVPIALLDVAAAAALIWAIVAAVRSFRAYGFRGCLVRAAKMVIVVAALVYLWFFLLWGLNYRRVPLETKLAYDASRVGREAAVKLAEMAIERANALGGPAARAPGDADALARSLGDVERMLGARRTAAVASPKRSLLAWYFRQAAIDGMTNPFFLEIIVNPDLVPAEEPFTLAHEWAHLAGYADESEANFVAWLACIRAAPSAQYSGWLAAYRYLTAVLPREERRRLAARLSPAVSADLAAINERLLRASPAVSRAARGAYDSYLRANRIDEGIANYGLVARLMLGTTFEENWRPVLKN